MIRISQIKCAWGHTVTADDIAKKLRCSPSDIRSFTIERESVDARDDELRLVYSVAADVRSEEKYLRRKDIAKAVNTPYILPEITRMPGERPLVVGFGPSGMMAALILAECGLKPIVIERGRPVEERSHDVERFFREGILDPASNVQFGEGGAGTFSDGKLTTRIKDHRIRKMLEEFIEAGADERILYQAMPHLGTDRLRHIVRNIRRKIISLGGEIRFSCTLKHLIVRSGRVCAAETDQGILPCTHVLLCLGHSAQDTSRNLFQDDLFMEQKDFAAGVRVEHPQRMIDLNQYGRFADVPGMPAASYRLSHHAKNGRGVYSFCMCPGGVVIPASTEEGTLAVNGMSYSARDGKNANSAILVQIPRKDFDHGHPLDGYIFQHELEKQAFRAGFTAPSQNIADYLNGKRSEELCLVSTFPRGTVCEDMHALFPAEVNDALQEGFISFERKIPGFISSGIMVGMESRSSSPVRITRNLAGESVSIKGVYPCGEGAGYAGGIVSSGVDGIRQAENVIRSF